MSKAARLRAQKARQRDPRREPWKPARPGERVETAFIPALTVNTDAAVKDMQRQTHDLLIDMLGTRRRSGIRWRHVHGKAECERILGLMYGDDREMWSGVEEHFLPFLAEHGDDAVMVVAECEAVRGDRGSAGLTMT